MAYFSRLTDIVTCNLTTLIARADNPQQALGEIIREIKEGIAGAERSAKTAAGNVERIQSEIAEQGEQVNYWVGKAKEQLGGRKDDQARQSLLRKREVEDLMAALHDQLRAAEATRNHLTTTMHALQARLADAERRLTSLTAGAGDPRATATSGAAPIDFSDDRSREIDVELERLRRELSGG